MVEYVLRNPQNSDLYLYQYGIEQCKPGHFYGPAVRDHFLIHYILSGKGIFEAGMQTYELGKHQGFLIGPGAVTRYKADENEPWHYLWFGFHGAQAEAFLQRAGLTAETPIFRYDRDQTLYHYFGEMLAAKAQLKDPDLKLVGLLYVLLSLLIDGSPGAPVVHKKETSKSDYVTKVLDFIEMNYAGKFTVSDIAGFIGLDRSYLCSLFKSSMKMSIQAYLIKYRVNKACELMKNSELTIADISRSVGYDDPLLFSKIFKKVKGSAPRDYRKTVGGAPL